MDARRNNLNSTPVLSKKKKKYKPFPFLEDTQQGEKTDISAVSPNVSLVYLLIPGAKPHQLFSFPPHLSQKIQQTSLSLNVAEPFCKNDLIIFTVHVYYVSMFNLQNIGIIFLLGTCILQKSHASDWNGP